MIKTNTKREQFLEACLKLIHEKGFKATTMRDIANEMNFEVANIYNYIKSKHQLLETYLVDIGEEFHIGIDDIMASSYTPIEKLRAVIALHVKLPTTKPYQIGLLINEWRNLKPKELEQFLKRRTEYEKKVKSIIREGMKKGEVTKMNLDVATHTLLSSVRWLYNWYTQDKPKKKINPVEMEKQITDFIFNGIKK